MKMKLKTFEAHDVAPLAFRVSSTIDSAALVALLEGNDACHAYAAYNAAQRAAGSTGKDMKYFISNQITSSHYAPKGYFLTSIRRAFDASHFNDLSPEYRPGDSWPRDDEGRFIVACYKLTPTKHHFRLAKGEPSPEVIRAIIGAQVNAYGRDIVRDIYAETTLAKYLPEIAAVENDQSAATENEQAAATENEQAAATPRGRTRTRTRGKGKGKGK